jgi:hypothetical protein
MFPSEPLHSKTPASQRKAASEMAVSIKENVINALLFLISLRSGADDFMA